MTIRNYDDWKLMSPDEEQPRRKADVYEFLPRRIESLFPANQLIEGRQIRDLYELRAFVNACIDAEGNVALDCPYDMRLIQKILPDTGKEVYDLEITRW